VTKAQANLDRAGVVREIEEVVADKGYHANKTLADCREWGVWGLRTYIPEPESGYERRWTDKPPEYEEAYRANRRRVRGNRSKRLQKKRSELVERSFAHMCNTGGARRTWLKGLEKINKRYLMHAAGRNLGLMMRKLFGVGTPRSLQGVCCRFCVLRMPLEVSWTAPRPAWAPGNSFRRKPAHFPTALQAA